MKIVRDLAEVELLLSVVYIAMVVVSAMQPVAQELAERVPEIKAGVTWAAVGMAIWTITNQIEKHLKKRIKK